MYENYVQASSGVYRQVIGIATKTRIVFSVLNLYMYLEFIFILSDAFTIIHERYIDDAFVIIRSEKDKPQIIDLLNKPRNICLALKIDARKAIILDLIVCNGPCFQQKSRLDSKQYLKSTRPLLYFPWVSNYLLQTKTWIVIEEAIRSHCSSSGQTA